MEQLQYVLLDKIGNVEVIEIIKEKTEKESFLLNFFMFRAFQSEKIQLESVNPIRVNSIEELRGFLKGFCDIIGLDFYVTAINENLLQLSSWTKISRLKEEVLLLDKKELNPQNLPNNIFDLKDKTGRKRLFFEG